MPDEPNTVSAMATGLNPTEGRNAWEQFMPLVFLVLWVGLQVLMAFEVVPNPPALETILDLAGLVVGGWAVKLGLIGGR